MQHWKMTLKATFEQNLEAKSEEENGQGGKIVNALQEIKAREGFKNNC